MPNKNFEEKFIIYLLLDNKQFLISSFSSGILGEANTVFKRMCESSPFSMAIVFTPTHSTIPEENEGILKV